MALPIIEQYELLKEIGSGVLGTTYRAFDHGSRREVALELFSLELALGPEEQARFRQEVRAMAGVKHPSLATIYAYGEYEGRQYIAREYVPGVSLRSKLAGGPLATSEIIGIGTQIGEALRQLHSRGILDLRISPRQVLLGEGGKVKLIDFGLAPYLFSGSRRMDSVFHSSAARVQIEESVVRAPELIRGDRVDLRTDIYGLGLLLYEMATGVPARTVHLAETWEAMTMPGIEGSLTPPRKLRPNLPPGLENIILRCLRDEPAQRYASVDEFLRDLGNLGVDFGAQRDLVVGAWRFLSTLALVIVGCSVAIRPRGLLPFEGRIHPGLALILRIELVGLALVAFIETARRFGKGKLGE